MGHVHGFAFGGQAARLPIGLRSKSFEPNKREVANAKRIVRKMEARIEDEIWWAMKEAFWSITPETYLVGFVAVSIFIKEKRHNDD